MGFGSRFGLRFGNSSKLSLFVAGDCGCDASLKVYVDFSGGGVVRKIVAMGLRG